VRAIVRTATISLPLSEADPTSARVTNGIDTLLFDRMSHPGRKRRSAAVSKLKAERLFAGQHRRDRVDPTITTTKRESTSISLGQTRCASVRVTNDLRG